MMEACYQRLSWHVVYRPPYSPGLSQCESFLYFQVLGERSFLERNRVAESSYGSAVY